MIATLAFYLIDCVEHKPQTPPYFLLFLDPGFILSSGQDIPAAECQQQ